MNTNTIKPVRGGSGGIGQEIGAAISDERRRGDRPIGQWSGQTGGIGIVKSIGESPVRGREGYGRDAAGAHDGHDLRRRRNDDHRVGFISHHPAR